MSRNNYAIYSRIDKFLMPIWVRLSFNDGQKAFKALNKYLGKSLLYSHVVASFLRFQNGGEAH